MLYNYFLPWRLPDAGKRYSVQLASAENDNGLPHNLLGRMAQEESAFRPDVISGKVTSPAGAVGIMQIVPKFHPGVDATNAVESIQYAGRYVRGLYDMFGTWSLALAAYNWGPGNLRRWQNNKAKMPAETEKYVSDILTDIYKY